MTRRSPVITSTAAKPTIVSSQPQNKMPISLPTKNKKQIKEREERPQEEMLEKAVRVPHKLPERKSDVTDIAPQKKKKNRLWVLPVVVVLVLGAVLCWLRWQQKQSRKGEGSRHGVVSLPDTSKCFGGSSFLPVASPAGCHPRLSGIHSTDQTAGSGHRFASELKPVSGVAVVSIPSSIDPERLRAFYQGELDLLHCCLETMGEIQSEGAQKTAKDLRDQIAVIEATLAAI